ncbi:MAG: hypothetical protein Fur0016_04300 [Anaerolineales bacterium]
MFKLLAKLFPLLLFASLMLAACGTVSVRPAAELTAEFQAAVEQTIAARDTATPLPTNTRPPTLTPTVTVTPTPTETPTPSPVPPTSVVETFCDNSKFLQDINIPDGTILAPGQVFEKTWAFQNIGRCTWKEGYTIAWVSGDVMSGTTRPLPEVVAPNGTVNATVRLTAPFKPGTYKGVWRLFNSKGEPFGDFVSVLIVVAGPGTPVPTPAP